MRIDIEKVDFLVFLLKELKKSQQRRDKLSEKLLNGDLSIKQRSSINNKIETESEYIIKQHHECHRFAVDLDIADYNEERYGEVELRGSITHYRHVKRPPDSHMED